MRNATRKPEALTEALGHVESYPAGLTAMQYYAESRLEGMPRVLWHAISDAYHDAQIFSDEFAYALGVQVGLSLAAGTDIDEAETARILADTHATWEADWGRFVPDEVYTAAERFLHARHREEYLATV